MRSQLFFFMFISFVLVSVQPAESRYFFRDGSKVEIQWHEKSGQIINKKVCFNYADDHKKFKQCRAFAEDYFVEECDYYKNKIKTVQKKYRAMYEEDKDKFCNAAESYQP